MAPTIPGLLAQTPPADGGLWSLFMQSFDAFTILLLVGSVVGIALVFLCLFEIRERNIVPRDEAGRLQDLARSGRWEDLHHSARTSDSVLGRIVAAAMDRSYRMGASTQPKDAAACFASTAGGWNEAQATSGPISTRVVTAASAASVAQHSCGPRSGRPSFR